MLDHEYTETQQEPGLNDYYPPIVSLERRLERGWRMIEEREEAGLPVDDLLRHFAELLDQYESAYDFERVAA